MLASNIMIVEDEGQSIIAMDLSNHLQGFGYNVVATAFSGEEAIALAAQHCPQLLIIDTMLKRCKDGISVALNITELLHIPVIFIIDNTDITTLQHFKAFSTHSYLIKPFRPEELYACIEVAFSKHALEQQLKESERWFAKTLHCISDAVVATDTNGKICFMNPVAEKVIGAQFEQVKGQDINEVMTLLTESSRTVIESSVHRVLRNIAIADPDCSAIFGNQFDEELPIDDGAAPILKDNGELLGAVMVFRDITVQRQIENSLHESEEHFKSAFYFAAIGMALVSVNNRFLLVNSSLCTLFGYSSEEFLKANLNILTYNKDHNKTLGHHLRQLLTNELQSFQIEQKCRHKTVGKVVWVLLSASLASNAVGEPQYFIIQIQDISDRKADEQQLVYTANHDPLTGLLNRLQFHDRFTQTLSSVQRHDTKLALLYLDLDGFKLINETLGHRTGDLLLQAVSDRLKRSIRINDILARLGGDEFIVLLSDINRIDDVARIAQNTLDMISKPFSLEGNEIMVTLSIGISVYPDDGKNSHVLLTNADTAMYRAKECGKNNYQFYTMEMTARSLERMTIERDLRHALTHHELRLQYQPYVDALTGRGVSVEARVSWQHPGDLKLDYSDRYIAIAEETGLIIPIGAWVLSMSCLQIKQWQENDGPYTQVAVNLSPRQFFENDLIETIKNILTEIGLKPCSLELSIAESAVMQDPERAQHVLQQLHLLGVKLSVDDFGRGFSSLTYLRQFSLNSIKIDHSLIQNIPGDEMTTAVVRAIIALGHELKLKVVAKGVETEEQAAFLKVHCCDELQGNLFGYPVAAVVLETESGTLL